MIRKSDWTTMGEERENLGVLDMVGRQGTQVGE